MYKEALFLQRRAESKLNPGCCLDTICTSKKKLLNDALNLYEKSGEKFILCNEYRKAGECYEKCGEIKLKYLNENPCIYYEKCIFCYQQINSDYNTKKISAKLNNYLQKKNIMI